MLPRKSLIPLKHEFESIRTKNRRFDSPSFGALIQFAGLDGGPQFAFIVSKKVDSRSVVRHEVKRRLAGAVTKFVSSIPKATRMVFLAKKKATQTTKEELLLEMQSLLQQAKLIK